jgi:radical SAM superfamily enzyme YgiQ (UPF0313 family)
MKVLLIQPPVQDFYQTSIRKQPIGLAYLGASLQSHGYEVEILDCQTERKKSIPIPPELSYLKEFYPFNDQSPFKLYTGFYHFGMDWVAVRKRIEDSRADVFGISSTFTPYHGEALEIARIIKEWDQKKTVVMGGAHVSCHPGSILRSPSVDYVVLGEGEIRFPELLKQIGTEKKGDLDEIDGIGYRKDGEIRINPLQRFIEDLDSVPHPARELLDLARYRIKRKRSTMIITSRGCPHGCAYCSTHLVMGASFRTRSAESVVQEMRECHQRYDIQVFDIEDDNFTFDRGRAEKLMNLIIGAFGEEHLELTAMNGVSFASLDRELLRLMKKVGFKTINLSFVSTDSFVKKRLGRPGSTDDFNRILEDSEKAGLNIIAYAILGMPGQTIEEMVETLIYLMGKRVLIGPSIYYPTPGTPLFKQCEEMDILPPYPSNWRSSAFPIETKEFDRLDMVTLFRLGRAINFIKGKMDEKKLSEGMTWKDLFKLLEDKVKAKVELLSPCDSRLASCGKVDSVTWADLLLLLFKEKSFFSPRKGSGRNVSAVKQKSSKKVLDYFFEKAWDKRVLKSRASLNLPFRE